MTRTVGTTFFRAMFCCLVALSAFCLDHGTAGGQSGQPVHRFNRSVVASHKNGQKHAYPSMSRLDDGRLMLSWSASQKSGTGSHIVTAFSADNGKTWSKPVAHIKTAHGRDYDPSILVSGKRIFVSSTTLPPDGKIETSTTWCTRSDDAGKTWSKLYKIPMNHRYTCGKTHQGLRLKSGTLLLGYSWDMFCEEGKSLISEGQMHLRAGVMISTDNGRTWQNGGDTDATVKKVHNGAVDGTDEPAIVELDDGSIYMLARTGSTHLYESRSTDEGRTWTTARPSPLFGCNAPAALCRFEAEDSAGNKRCGIMCVWNNAIARHPLSAAASFDGGKTWSKPKNVSGQTGGGQASYPTCSQAADGTLVAVWQQDTPDGRDIRAARFNLAWLLHDPLEELQKELAEVSFPALKATAPAKGYNGGDPLKSKPVWKIHGDGGKLTDKGSIRLKKGGGYHIDNRPSDWDGDINQLVECRMRVIDRDKMTGAHSAAEIWIGGRRPKTGCQLFFRENAVAFDSSYHPCHKLDATKTHTYKILTEIETGKAYLFIDNSETPVLVTYLGSPEGLDINRILFGDSSGSSATVHGQSEWEFVRWRTAPAVPLEIKRIDKRDKTAAAWTGKGPLRMIVEISPWDLGKRKSDIVPARLKVDLAEILAQAGIKGRPDLACIQVVRLDPKTGRPTPCKTFRGIGADDVPYRFDDFDRHAYSHWYNIRGNGHSGQIVWEHLQEGNSPTKYAIYIDTVKSNNESSVSPVPTLGDSDALWTDRSDGFLITALQCKPYVCDWDGDGRLDIIAGETQGHLFLFKNKGTPKKPKFDEGEFLMADGKHLRLQHYTAPCATDWDDDGDLDLIIGRANEGQIHFFENTGSTTKPVLTERGHVEADGSRIVIPHELTPGESIFSQEYGCRPEVVDYDGDGDKDLLAGGYVSGAVFLFENTRNGKGIPQLTARGPIEADGKTLDVGSAAMPCLADFDGDGDLDMISAHGDVIMGQFDPHGIAYYENTGTRAKPVFARRPFPFESEHAVGLAVASKGDMDADGDLDLVIGNYLRIWF
ncbi:MAG: exo-alpha-sialidase, partial [Pirellulales bacterium]|nr:exo-alpha-sialidase [Pirellulales bacterium]